MCIEELQSQTEIASHGIYFPRLEKCGKTKDGCSSYSPFYLNNISNEKIHKVMKRDETRAQETVEKLGIPDKLKKCKMWAVPPLAVNLKVNDKDDDEDNEDNDKNYYVDDAFVTSTDGISNLAEDIEKLYANDFVDSSVRHRVKKKTKTVIPF